MALTDERRGEIALALVELRFRREGINLSSGTGYELGALAVDTGIPISELEEFMFELLPKAINAAFGYEYVSVTPHGRRNAPSQGRVASGDGNASLLHKMNN